MRPIALAVILILSALVAALTSEGQPPMPGVGILNMQTPDSETTQLTAIRQGLREAGFVEGQSVAFDLRFAEGRNDRLPVLAAELVRRRVDLIVANTTPPAIAAKSATSSIPIVFVFGADRSRRQLQ